MRCRRRHGVSAGELTPLPYRHPLDDRLLIPADGTALRDCIFVSSSVHSVRLNSGLLRVQSFRGWMNRPGHGRRIDGVEQCSKTHAPASTNINANRLLRTSECLVKQTRRTGQCMHVKGWNNRGLIEKLVTTGWRESAKAKRNFTPLAFAASAIACWYFSKVICKRGGESNLSPLV